VEEDSMTVLKVKKKIEKMREYITHLMKKLRQEKYIERCP
jgi:hypothetical protein